MNRRIQCGGAFGWATRPVAARSVLSNTASTYASWKRRITGHCGRWERSNRLGYSAYLGWFEQLRVGETRLSKRERLGYQRSVLDVLGAGPARVRA